MLASIREDPILAERTKLGLLVPLSQLYGNGASVAQGDELEAANQASSRFAWYYHHSAPFDREILADLWSRCDTDAGLPRRCRRARARAERILGKLSRHLAAATAGIPQRAEAGGSQPPY